MHCHDWKKSGVGGFSKILRNFQSGSWQMITFAYKVGGWGEKRPKICLRNTWMVPYEIKIGTSENNTYLGDDFHALSHRSKYVCSEIGVGSKECFDFSVDIGSQWQIFDLVFSRNQNCWFNIASISKLPTRIGLSNNAWLKKKYFLIKPCFCICDK